jgi:AmiR/NasT family two-component response regulator
METETKAYRILVAEDDFFVAEEICATAAQAGFEVVGRASHGDEAVSLAASLMPDAVLMDIRMPRRNGIEAAQLIRRSCPAPVVMLSAYEDDALIEEASAAGASAYLTKPAKSAEMYRTIRLAIARFQETQAANLQLEAAAAKARAAGHGEGEPPILAMCCYCKGFRAADGQWQDAATYVTKMGIARISHSICPECLPKWYPEGEEDGL